MKKLSLLLAGAMMVPAIGGAANQAVTVTHGTQKVKTSQRIEISDGILADGTAKVGKDFTMSTWVKVSNYDMAYTSNFSVSSGLPSTGMIMGHRARNHDNTNGTFWVGYGTDGTIHLSGKFADTARFESDAKMEIDEWTYLTLTYNAGEWTVYKNGESVGSGNCTLSGYFGDTECADDNFNGTIYFLGSQNFNGAFDEFQFWPRALSAEEVASAMDDARDVDGITVLYTFDETNADGLFSNEITDSEKASYVAGYFNNSYSGSWGIAGGGHDTMVGQKATLGTPEFVEGRELAVEYCIYTPTKNSTHTERRTEAIKLTSNDGTEFTVDKLQTEFKMPIYWDKTDEIVSFFAGDSITVTPTAKGVWMHNFLWIDWGKDGVFTPILNEFMVPQKGSDLVAHTGMNTTGSNPYYKSDGTACPGNDKNYGELSDVLPAFQIPADMKPGIYRARYIVDWNSDDACGHESETKNSLTGNGGIMVDFSFEVKVKQHAERTITIASNDDALGTVAFVGAEGNTLTSTQNVAVVATVTDADAYFVNWTDAEGNILSTTEEYLYDQDGDVALTANFRQHFQVEFTSNVKVENELGQISSPMILDKGTVLTVTPIVPEGKLAKNVLVNGEAIEAVEGKYTVTVEGATTIDAEFDDIMSTLNVVVEGNGRVVVATADNEGTPEGIIENEGQVAYGTTVYVYLYPDTEEELLSAVCNDYDWFEGGDCEEVEGGYMFSDTAYDTELLVTAKFTSVGNSIEMIEAADDADAVYYNLQGVRVDRANLVPGIYVRRSADKAQKVIVK